MLAAFALFAILIVWRPTGSAPLRFSCTPDKSYYHDLVLRSSPAQGGNTVVSPADSNGYTTGEPTYYFSCFDKSMSTLTVSVTAKPYTGYRFDHWEGDCSGSSATLPITFTGTCNNSLPAANKSCTAVFASTTDMGNIDMSSNDGGGGSGGTGGGGGGGGSGGMCDGPCPPKVPLTNRTSHVNKTLRGVAYDAYIAVGDNGALTTSTDGLTWTAGSFGALSGMSFTGVAASATATNHYVAVAGSAAYSPDAATWTAATLGTPPTAAADVVWGHSLYVTAGRNGEFCTSPDGVTWTTHAQGAGFNNTYPTRLVWTGAQFVVVGGTSANGPFIATSPDGTTWTMQTVTATVQFLDGVAWGNSMLVAVGNGTATAAADVITSSDGITWTRQPTASALLTNGRALAAVGWTGKWWLALGSNGASLISADGITWSAGNQVNNADFAAATSGGPRGLVIVGSTGAIVTAEQ